MELIPVWKVEVNGCGYLEDDFDHIIDLLDSMDEDSSYTITKQFVTREYFESLPDFTGF